MVLRRHSCGISCIVNPASFNGFFPTSTRLLVSYSERMRELNERDKKWLTELNLQKLDRALRILYVLFIVLSVLDVASTLIAMTLFQDSFHELNGVAAILFGDGIPGFVFSTIVLKVIPGILIIYPLLLKPGDNLGAPPHQIRQVKLAAIIALIVVDLFYGYVVPVHNLPLLISRIV